MADMNDVKPIGKVVTFDEAADYYKLRALLSDAERCNTVAIVAQQQAQAAFKVRDAFVKQMADKYGFDATFKQMQSDDDTQSFSFS